MDLTVIDHHAQRLSMIEGQMRPNRVTEPALVEALGHVPREHFAPAVLRSSAYVDEDLPLGDGRFLIEPLVLARLIQAIGVRAGAKVLDIGCATGYGAAVLARLGARVVALDDDAMARRASSALSALGVGGVDVVAGPPRDGWAAGAPYDGILIEGGVGHLPEHLFEQLGDSGRLAAVMIGQGVGRLASFNMVSGTFARRDLFDAWVPPLAAFAPAPRFVF